jgi:hypothetical protein
MSLYLVKISWVCFLLSITLSLVAYLISNAAITEQMEIAENYYVNNIAAAFDEENWLSELNNWINYMVGLLFLAAITIVIIFVIINLKQQEHIMSEKETKVTTQTVQFNDSAIIPTMQRVPASGGVFTNSAQIPTMQAAPSAASQSQPQPQTQSSQQSTSQSQSGDT